MALQRQTAEVNLSCGIETKLDSKLVPSNRSLVASNVSFVNAGSASTRYGYTSLPVTTSTGSTISAGIALSTPNADLAMQDGSQYYVYGQNAATWIPQGASVPCSLSAATIIANSATQTDPTSAVAGNIIAAAWEDSRGGVRYTVRDVTDPNIIYIADTELSSAASKPQMVAIGTTIYLAVAANNGGTYALNLYSCSSQSPASGFGILANLTNELNTSYPVFGINQYGNTTGLIFAFLRTTNFIAVGTCNAIGGSVAVYVSGVAGSQYSVAVATENSATPNFTIAFGQGTFPYALYCTNIDLSNPANYTAIAQTARAGNVTFATVAYKGDGTNTWQAYYGDAGSSASWPAVRGFNYTATSLNSSTTLYGLSPVSHTTYYNTLYPLLCCTPVAVPTGGAVSPDPTSNQTTYFTIDQAGNVYNRFFVQNAGGAPTYSLANITNVSGVLYTSAMQKIALRVDPSGQLYSSTGIATVNLDFTDTSSCMAVSWDTEQFVNDGKCQIFDGGTLVEAGFNMYPELNGGTYSSSNSGGSLTGNSTYTWYVVYEWMDYAGRWHRSAPSFPLQKLTASGGSGTAAQASFFIPYLPLTQRSGTRGTVQIAVYRTLANGSVPYRVHALNAYPNLTDGTAGFTFTDTASDTTIASNDILYSYASVGGVPLSEVQNDPPPSFSFVAEGQTRIIGIPQEKPLTFWYTKPRVPDRAPEFSLYQTGVVEATGGPLTAVGFLNDDIVLFKSGRIYRVSGYGPNALGQPANGYSTPMLISSTDGCTAPRSVVKTDQGLFFQGNRGIMLLDRSFTVQYIGSPVEAYRSYPVTGSVLVPAQNQIRFATNSNITLVYDYLLQQWSTYNYGGVSAAAWNLTTPVVLTSAGVVRQEVSEQTTDDGVGIGLTYRTAWLKPAEIAQGYARVWQMELIGNYLGTHTLYIDIYTDYELQPVATLSWSPASALNSSSYGDDSPYGSGSPYGGSGSSVYQVRSRIPVQRCEAISFQFRTGGNSGASCQLNKLALVLGVIGQVNRLPSNKTV